MKMWSPTATRCGLPAPRTRSTRCAKCNRAVRSRSTWARRTRSASCRPSGPSRRSTTAAPRRGAPRQSRVARWLLDAVRGTQRARAQGARDPRNGTYIDYHGDGGQERMLRRVDSDKTETTYRAIGPGMSAIDRVTNPDGSYTDFGGGQGKEFKVAFFSRGPPRKLEMYRGKRGHERLVKVGYLRDDIPDDPNWLPDDDGWDFYKEEYYLGPKGQEHLYKEEHVPVRGSLTDGNHTIEYTGPKGQERIKHITWPDRRDYWCTNASGHSYRHATYWLCGTMDKFDPWGNKISSSPCAKPPGKAPSAPDVESGKQRTPAQKKRNKAPRRAPAADPEALRRAAVRKRGQRGVARRGSTAPTPRPRANLEGSAAARAARAVRRGRAARSGARVHRLGPVAPRGRAGGSRATRPTRATRPSARRRRTPRARRRPRPRRARGAPQARQRGVPRADAPAARGRGDRR